MYVSLSFTKVSLKWCLCCCTAAVAVLPYCLLYSSIYIYTVPDTAVLNRNIKHWWWREGMAKPSKRPNLLHVLLTSLPHLSISLYSSSSMYYHGNLYVRGYDWDRLQYSSNIIYLCTTWVIHSSSERAVLFLEVLNLKLFSFQLPPTNEPSSFITAETLFQWSGLSTAVLLYVPVEREGVPGSAVQQSSESSFFLFFFSPIINWTSVVFPSGPLWFVVSCMYHARW